MGSMDAEKMFWYHDEVYFNDDFLYQYFKDDEHGFKIYENWEAWNFTVGVEWNNSNRVVEQKRTMMVVFLFLFKMY